MTAPALLARTPSDPSTPWVALTNSRPQDTLRLLRGGGETRPERLAWAAAQVAQQPATDANMLAAEKVLVELAAGDDDVAAQAAYLRGRIYQLHLTTPDYPKAAELYRQLAERRPQSHWAQLAMVKLAVLKLYLLPESTAAGADRLAVAEAWLAKIQEPKLQRDLHLQIGQAGIALQQPLERFLPHLVAADRIGGISGNAGEDLLVQIGVLSERQGLWTQAIEYFERYLREYPTNVRAFTVRKKLEAVRLRLAPEGTRT